MRFIGICIVFIATILGCTHTAKEIPLGVQDHHASYVPARIAVLKCQSWPTGARFKTLPLTNLDSKELEDLCKKFDQFVLEGFEDQPYMRGLSPKAVETLLVNANQLDFLNQVPPIWQHKGEDCADCKNAPAFYFYSVAERQEWRDWLARLSRQVRNADAVLMPFILYGDKSRFVDRGVATARVQVGALMLLVDTNSGALLWSGGRNSEANNRILEAKNPNEDVPLPIWDEVYERLLTSDLWREFPGRQEY